MKKTLFTIIISLLASFTFAQVKFEKGYFIDNNNQRTDCLIKNLGWKNNPTSFEYKALKDSSSTNTQTATIETIKEFGVEGAFRYSRFTVQMDKSSSAISDLTKDREPVFEEATLFLKLLVGGKINLYVYETGKLTRFFYNTPSGDVNQLVYKLYKTESGEISKNVYYQQQLWNEVKCEELSMSDAKRVRYLQNDLIKYFVKYNECENADLILFQKGKSKMPFSLSLRPGVTFANTTMESVSDNEIDFGSKTNLRIGLEAEFVLPYNKNKWAIVIEPTYQSFESEGMLLTQNVSFEYHSIDFPLKLRYYSFLNDNSKIYLNAGVLTSLLFNSEITFGTNDVRALDNDLSFTLGAGYNFKNRLNLEFILNGSRDLTRDNLNWETKYNAFSIILGYKLFSNAKN
ncbi:porin family protein [Chondrinema litorale]|uniref:porin family protein n=1 Tax=Chondrinema litorale TaxID=2994555 RepID=UPI002543BCA8|nr:porin family protein [Chondrinema litorale]UZR99248.1 porin family protein [Chondrinema litorale]